MACLGRQSAAGRARTRDAHQGDGAALRFGRGSSRRSHKLEFLSDNGGAYIGADTRALLRSLGLRPINNPSAAPQSNGMADGFVNTFKRDELSPAEFIPLVNNRQLIHLVSEWMKATETCRFDQR